MRIGTEAFDEATGVGVIERVGADVEVVTGIGTAATVVGGGVIDLGAVGGVVGVGVLGRELEEFVGVAELVEFVEFVGVVVGEFVELVAFAGGGVTALGAISSSVDVFTLR